MLANNRGGGGGDSSPMAAMSFSRLPNSALHRSRTVVLPAPGRRGRPRGDAAARGRPRSARRRSSTGGYDSRRSPDASDSAETWTHRHLATQRSRTTASPRHVIPAQARAVEAHDAHVHLGLPEARLAERLEEREHGLVNKRRRRGDGWAASASGFVRSNGAGLAASAASWRRDRQVGARPFSKAGSAERSIDR